MAQYAIMRFAKHKGYAGALEAHHERTKAKYASNPNINTERSKYNFHIIKPTKSYKKEVDDRINAAGCRTRKDSVRYIDTIITASPIFFKGKSKEERRKFFETAVEFLSRKIGRKNIFTAVVHLDEKTPHIHLVFTPITKDGRLSAKDIIGNRDQLVKWQDDFFKHMVREFPDIERGESASRTGRKHIPTRVFKQAVKLTRQATIITDTLNSINPINAGKKKDEVLSMLNKFFPSMENFETQVKKYKRENTQLEKEKAALAEKAKAGEQRGVKEALKQSKLQSDYNNLKRFVDSLPEEIKQQAKQSRRAHLPER